MRKGKFKILDKNRHDEDLKFFYVCLKTVTAVENVTAAPLQRAVIK